VRQDKDRCSKWLIDHHGDAILHLAGVRGFSTWRAVQSELVAPRRLPDGLLEVTFPGDPGPSLFLIEIETFADRSVAPQLFEDILLTRMDRGAVPDVVTLVLRPKGRAEVADHVVEVSRHGLASLRAAWRVVRLWELDAEELLAAGDVGLVPWVPLTRFPGPPEQLLRQCRERIDRGAKPAEHEVLLVVTALLSMAAFNDEALLDIFGGSRTMLELPYLDKLFAIKERRVQQRHILDVLDARFGKPPEDLAEKVRSRDDADVLQDLLRFAATCPDLEAFRVRLTSV
jgi:hypothetical protein